LCVDGCVMSMSDMGLGLGSISPHSRSRCKGTGLFFSILYLWGMWGFLFVVNRLERACVSLLGSFGGYFKELLYLYVEFVILLWVWCLVCFILS